MYLKSYHIIKIRWNRIWKLLSKRIQSFINECGFRELTLHSIVGFVKDGYIMKCCIHFKNKRLWNCMLCSNPSLMYSETFSHISNICHFYSLLVVINYATVRFIPLSFLAIEKRTRTLQPFFYIFYTVSSKMIKRHVTAKTTNRLNHI